MTIREATSEWVDRFDAVQTDMLRKLYGYDPDEWREVTTPSVGENVYVYGRGAGEISAVKSYLDGETEYEIELDDTGDVICVSADEFEVENDTVFPMWGTMWQFSDSADEWWMEHGGIEALSRCGFRVYESDEFGYFFGIDGCGYDFKNAHFIPLYKERGLRWHDEPAA